MGGFIEIRKSRTCMNEEYLEELSASGDLENNKVLKTSKTQD